MINQFIMLENKAFIDLTRENNFVSLKFMIFFKFNINTF